MRTVFSDDNGNEMDVYINDKEFLSLSVGASDKEKWYEWGIINLNRMDVQELIKKLQEIEPLVTESSQSAEFSLGK